VTVSKEHAPRMMTTRERTAEEKWYDASLAACVYKPGHAQHIGSKLAAGRMYTVTTIASSERYGGMRTVALCRTFDRAKEIVESNEGDIWEFSYMLAVIEAVVPDELYGGLILDEQYWYKWDLERKGYRPIECPPGRENVFGYGIG